jgi:Lrp/AsnC family transcriptional regulator
VIGAKTMDIIDKRILRIVQKDARLSIGEIATHVGLSQTPCWKRLQRLDATGVIMRRIALLDPAKIGLELTVLVTIEVGDHAGKALARFAAEVAAMDAVMDFYRLAGDVEKVTSRFALENIKSETAFPIDC